MNTENPTTYPEPSVTSTPIKTLLSAGRFALQEYQREYTWGEKQIVELINDLSSRFREFHREEYEQEDRQDDRSRVQKYGNYFLGSIIILEEDGKMYIVDGQQRLTSLTLILIYILRKIGDISQISTLIHSESYGRRSYNLDVDDREACMDSIYKDGISSFAEANQPDSITKIVDRYRDIEDGLSEMFTDTSLAYFNDWLINRVHVAQIKAYSDGDAYTIFETVNDRGLPLTPTDMLKGYLLVNMDAHDRDEANKSWRHDVAKLHGIGKGEDADAIKGWLRGQHAKSIRKRKGRAEPLDYDLIGTQFHRWVRLNEENINLLKANKTKDEEAFKNFICRDFRFYSKWYCQIRECAKSFNRSVELGLEEIHYNAKNKFTLQYPALLASIIPDDSVNEVELKRKLRIVARYIDIMIVRRIWNGKSTSYGTMKHHMFSSVIRKIREQPASEIAKILTTRLEKASTVELEFKDNPIFQLHGRNGPQIHGILARLIDYVEMKSGRINYRYNEYIRRGGSGYEIEHILPNRFKDYTDDFDNNENQFAEYRNRIGALILLPKRNNASYNNKLYKDKISNYLKENILAQSLHEDAYKPREGFSGFQEFIRSSNLKSKFKAYSEFNKSSIEERQNLCQSLAEQIWDPKVLIEASKS